MKKVAMFLALVFTLAFVGAPQSSNANPKASLVFSTDIGIHQTALINELGVCPVCCCSFCSALTVANFEPVNTINTNKNVSPSAEIQRQRYYSKHIQSGGSTYIQNNATASSNIRNKRSKKTIGCYRWGSGKKSC